ncbi:MAG: nucleoside triphosphate pyrophosphohydrolase [Alphaproteobacteria bacterium]|nr:nucleoside triphosphate pyrophosphohydrolase [Alphaproteobacteria bacterium]MBV8548691.1 nucleoside triphosphate pyrophosphohydrolase [Alphaproteobacteria bacterium]
MSKAVDRIVEVMARLRNPDGGCPWDLEQDFKTIAPFTIEETYELVDAIEKGDPKAMQDELGDVLFQVAFHAQMGAEKGWFTLDSVANHVSDKMIERHPHVFGARDVADAADVLRNWENDKATKRQAAAGNGPVSALDGVTNTLPAMTLAVKLQKRAARVGFDWSKAEDILDKMNEEMDELKAEMAIPNNKERLQDELGDVLFVICNLARHLDIDPETALRSTNRKFDRRFRAIEQKFHTEGRELKNVTLDEMETAWNVVKRAEKDAA